ncbi:MAG: hypothetical protein FWD38_10195 [Oscillospiraceae bacterium]|nr:hypothetical protein [Oscillospiraceae bacterium]
MYKIIVDEEFRLLLPKLDKATYESLEKNIIAHGVRDPLVVWNDILIDGYNRYRICTEHNLPFAVVSMEFNSRDEVQNWIIENQISRRNLNPVELSHFRGLYFNAVKRMQGSRNQYIQKNEKPQSEVFQKGFNTAKVVGEKFNVSKATIERDSMVANSLTAIAEISPEAKEKILSGEVAVDRSKLQRLSKASKDEIKEVVNQINTGTYDRNDYRIKKTPENTGTQKNSSHIQAVQFKSTDNNLNSIINEINNEINITINSLSPDSSLSELKQALKILIESLEKIFDNILLSWR